MIKRLLLLILAYFLGFNADSQSTEAIIKKLQSQLDSLEVKKEQLNTELEDYKLEKVRKDLKNYGLPKLENGDEVIEHSALSLLYDESHEQAKWVAHIITADILNGKHGRSNDFRSDTMIKSGSAVDADYFLKHLQEDSTYEYDGFGYDRGHLAPSADFSWSQKALSESYLYSNMSPQLAEFNRESWAELEGLLRGYISDHSNTQLYVVTGPILKDDLPVIERGKNQVSIPEEFFKVVIDLENQQGVGFIVPNKKIHYPLTSYAMNIDKVEEITGLNFYDHLDDFIEEKIEKSYDINLWIPVKNKNDVEPLYPPDLPPKYFNTVQAKIYVDNYRDISICGKIVSTKVSRNGHIFMNVDKSFPNQIFTICIWKKNHSNFSYDIIKQWEGKTVCVTGNVIEFSGTPTMILDKENQIKEYSKILWKE